MGVGWQRRNVGQDGVVRRQVHRVDDVGIGRPRRGQTSRRPRAGWRRRLDWGQAGRLAENRWPKRRGAGIQRDRCGSGTASFIPRRRLRQRQAWAFAARRPSRQVARGDHLTCSSHRCNSFSGSGSATLRYESPTDCAIRLGPNGAPIRLTQRPSHMARFLCALTVGFHMAPGLALEPALASTQPTTWSPKALPAALTQPSSEALLPEPWRGTVVLTAAATNALCPAHCRRRRSSGGYDMIVCRAIALETRDDTAQQNGLQAMQRLTVLAW